MKNIVFITGNRIQHRGQAAVGVYLQQRPGMPCIKMGICDLQDIDGIFRNIHRSNLPLIN